MEYLNNNYINIYKYQKDQYKDILKILFKKCVLFQIVEEYGDLDVEKLEIYEDFIQERRLNKWPGTVIDGDKAYSHSFKMTKKLERFFSQYDRFIVEEDFCFSTIALDDQSDYSFFEENGECLLFTITHEGEVYLREDIYNQYFLKNRR